MSKPMGPIPAGFAADADGMLLIGGRRADALVAEAGDTPLVRLRPRAGRRADRPLPRGLSRRSICIMP